MKKLIVLLLLIAIFCTGCVFDCRNCEELEEEISDLECEYENKISDLEEQIEEIELEHYGELDDLICYFSTVEEYLNGVFTDVDIEVALDAAIEGRERAKEFKD